MRIAWATVRPPIPLSKIPIGAELFASIWAKIDNKQNLVDSDNIDIFKLIDNYSKPDFCNMSKLVLFYAAIICIPLFSIAQVDSIALSEEYFNMGMDIYDYQHRRQAKDNFVRSVQFDQNNTKAQIMAGKSIMLTAHKEEALKYFLDAWILEE